MKPCNGLIHSSLTTRINLEKYRIPVSHDLLLRLVQRQQVSAYFAMKIILYTIFSNNLDSKRSHIGVRFTTWLTIRKAISASLRRSAANRIAKFD